MAEKALTEKAKQDTSSDKHLWPCIDRLVRENPENVRQDSRPTTGSKWDARKMSPVWFGPPLSSWPSSISARLPHYSSSTGPI